MNNTTTITAPGEHPQAPLRAANEMVLAWAIEALAATLQEMRAELGRTRATLANARSQLDPPEYRARDRRGGPGAPSTAFRTVTLENAAPCMLWSSRGDRSAEGSRERVLTLLSGGEERWISPVPEGWDRMDDGALRALWHSATPRASH